MFHLIYSIYNYIFIWYYLQNPAPPPAGTGRACARATPSAAAGSAPPVADDSAPPVSDDSAPPHAADSAPPAAADSAPPPAAAGGPAATDAGVIDPNKVIIFKFHITLEHTTHMLILVKFYKFILTNIVCLIFTVTSPTLQP